MEEIKVKVKEYTDEVIQKVEEFKSELVSAQNKANEKAEVLEQKFDTKSKEYWDKHKEIKTEFETTVKSIEDKIKSSDDVAAKFNEQLHELKDALIAQAKNDREQDNSAKEVKFHEALRKAIEGKDGLIAESMIDGEKVIGFKDYLNDKFNATIEVPIGAKAAVDMTAANVLGGDSADFFTTYDPNLVDIRLTNNVHVEQIFPAQMIADKYFTILVETTYFDGAETRLEGEAAAQSSFKLDTVSFNVFDISTDFQLSQETLEDMNMFVSEINRLAPDKIASVFDDKILAGSGDGITDFKPLSDYATAIDFENTQTDYSHTIAAANIIDVFAAVQTYMETTDETPNFAISHTNDMLKLSSLKDADGNSLNDRRVSWKNGVPTTISGLTIVKNRNVGANKMFIGDVREAVIAKRGNLTIQVGYNTDDWSKRMVTVRCDMRAAFAVRRNAAFAYVSSISQAIVDLTPRS